MVNNSDEYKIKLIPFEKGHVPKTVEWVNDEEIIKLTDRSPEPVTLEGCYKWYDGIMEDKTKKLLAITADNGRSHIGNCGLFEIDKRSKKAKLWIYIGEKDYWGKGLGRKALKQLLDLGFQDLGLNRIYLYIVEDNTRAQKLYESVGFAKEGICRDDTFIDGRYKNTIYYGLLKEEYGQGAGSRRE
jgi:RimJ/RimL family protein N-acetyltransferase